MRCAFVIEAQDEPVLDPGYFDSVDDEPQSFASLVTLRKLQGIMRAATEVTIRHATGRPKVRSAEDDNHSG